MSKKRFFVFFTALLFALFMCTLVSFAAGWERNELADGSHTWSYVNDKGARLTSDRSGSVKWHLIDGKHYAFDEDGNMLYGWITQDGSMADAKGWTDSRTLYYCGGEDDGARAENEWRVIEVNDPEYDTPQEYRFYFCENGRKLYADELPVLEKMIDGKKYAFDDFGRMLSGWVNLGDGSETTEEGLTPVTDYRYYSSTGSGRRVSEEWFKSVPPADLDREDSVSGDEEQHWFYVDKKGIPVSSCLKTIGRKTYGFNRFGEMLHGLCYLVFDENGYIDDASSSFDLENADSFTSPRAISMERPSGLYYFGDEDDGVMKTGKKTVYLDGSPYEFCFESSGLYKGCGINGEYKSAFWVYGCRLKAEKGSSCAAYALGYDSEDGPEHILLEITPSVYKEYGPEGIIETLGASRIIYVDEKGRLVKADRFTKLITG